MYHSPGDLMSANRKNYTFRLDEDIVRQLRREAAEQNRSFSNMVETILISHINSRISDGSDAAETPAP